MNINYIKQALDYTVRKAAEKAGIGQPSRNRKLSCAGVIRLLIGAEGGSLAKELHRADINVTSAAVSQRRAQIVPETFQNVFQRFNTSCKDSGNFRGYRLLAVDGTSVNMCITSCTSIRFTTCATKPFMTHSSSRSRRRTKSAH